MNQINTKLWTNNFIILSLINFFMILIFFLLNATITLYAINEFNATSGQAGIITGIFIIGSLVGRLCTGRLVQTKKILMISLLFFTLTILLYFVQLNIGFLILSRFLNGITVGIVTTVVSTIVVLSIPNSRKGEGISYFAISTALATGVGPFIGLFIGIISMIIGSFVKFTAPKKTNIKQGKGLRISDFIEPKVIPIGIIMFIMAFSFSSIVSYLNVYALDLGLLDAASFFFMV